MRHQDRAVQMVEDVLRCAAKNILAQAGMAIGPHDDKIAAIVVGTAQQGVARIIAGGWKACGLHLDPVAGQGLGKVSSGD